MLFVLAIFVETLLSISPLTLPISSQHHFFRVQSKCLANILFHAHQPRLDDSSKIQAKMCFLLESRRELQPGIEEQKSQE